MINHSGGADGADLTWEVEGAKYGVETIAYSFHNHFTRSKNQKILMINELNEGFKHIKIASKSIGRPVDKLSNYARDLLARNWFQVKNSDAIFAVGSFQKPKRENENSAYSMQEVIDSNKLITGGTDWAVQMAIDNKKPVYFFDQEETHIWYDCLYDLKCGNSSYVFVGRKPGFTADLIPKLTENFAGIGSREINKFGIKAIKDILKFNFENETT